MCGICGIAFADGERHATPETLSAMSAQLAHRGPDDHGLWHEGPVGLAHRRLCILDPTPAGHQPMVSPCGRYVLVYNGEVYNFAGLREELASHGFAFHTQCDTEVVLAALMHWGDDALNHFNGMFAIAFHDRERRRLLLARDRLGIKPLLYAERPGMLAFASELPALLNCGCVEGLLDPAALDAYFTFLYVPAPDTILRGVHKLLPGERLVYENGVTTRTRWWQPQFEPEPAWNLDDAAARFTELLTDSIRLRRIADVPLGAFLSGGMDSSSVVAVLSKMSDRPVKTFSIGFEEPEANELAYARQVAERFGTDHTEMILRPNLTGLLPKIARHLGEPFADSSALPTWLVSEIARRSVTVALSGDGGDELFAGYTWLHMNRRVAQYRHVPTPVRRMIDVVLRRMFRSPRVARMQRFSADSFLSPLESFRRRLTCMATEERRALLVPEATEAAAKAQRDRFAETAASLAGLDGDEAMLALDAALYLPGDILTKVDLMSMAHGLEARVPLLDHRIVEFAATLPFHLKYDGHTSKRVMKHAVRELLPPTLLAQRKRGFSLPIHTWFRGSTLRDFFQDAVLTPDAHCGTFLRRRTIENTLDDHTAGRENHGHRLWAILMFELWLRNLDPVPGLCTED